MHLLHVCHHHVKKFTRLHFLASAFFFLLCTNILSRSSHIFLNFFRSRYLSPHRQIKMFWIRHSDTFNPSSAYGASPFWKEKFQNTLNKKILGEWNLSNLRNKFIYLTFYMPASQGSQ